MKVFTSNFRRSGHHPGAVSIANTQRFYWNVPRYKPLIPPFKLVRDSKDGLIPREEFDRVYRAQLSRLNPRWVLCDLADIAPEVVLCCWEKPGAYCHRRLAAEWLESELGITVREL